MRRESRRACALALQRRRRSLRRLGPVSVPMPLRCGSRVRRRACDDMPPRAACSHGGPGAGVVTAGRGSLRGAQVGRPRHGALHPPPGSATRPAATPLASCSGQPTAPHRPVFPRLSVSRRQAPGPATARLAPPTRSRDAPRMGPLSAPSRLISNHVARPRLARRVTVTPSAALLLVRVRTG